MGRGLIHPIDNMSPSKTPTHPELLATLAKEMVAHKFDLKWFIRELVSSRTYQLSSVGSGEARPQWFQHARSRPLSAEELAESWRIATGYTEVEKASGKKSETSRFRPLDGYLVQFFGTPNTGTGDFQGGLPEHLYMNNGPLGPMITAARAASRSTSATRRSRSRPGSSDCFCRRSIAGRPRRRARSHRLPHRRRFGGRCGVGTDHQQRISVQPLIRRSRAHVPVLSAQRNIFPDAL